MFVRGIFFLKIFKISEKGRKNNLFTFTKTIFGNFDLSTNLFIHLFSKMAQDRINIFIGGLDVFFAFGAGEDYFAGDED